MLTQQDLNFLTEYSSFTSKHFLTIARTIAGQAHETRKELAKAKNEDETLKLGNELGHLISHLYLLNYMQIEAFCSLLYALVHPDNGILSAHLSFAANKPPYTEFVDKLRNRKISLEDIGISIPNEGHGSEAHRLAETQLKNHLKKFSDILQLQDNTLRDTYNKLKHGCVVVRHPDILYSEKPVEALETDSVYIPREKREESFISRISLSTKKGGNPPEDDFLLNIDYISKMSENFTMAILNSMKNGLSDIRTAS